MDFIERLMDSHLSRAFSNLGVIFVVLLAFGGCWKDNINAESRNILAIGGTFIILLYVIFTFTKQKFNKIFYVSLTFTILASAFVLKHVCGLNVTLLVWPLVWLIGYGYVKYKWLSLILAGVTITDILILMSPPAAAFPEILFALIGLYLATSGFEYRRNIYEIDKAHLQELGEAHRKLQETYAELQEASVHSMRYAALEERSRLSHEIHDGLGHQLTSLIIQLQALQIMLKENPEQASDSVDQLLDIARRAMAEVRLAVREWSDDEMGLGLVALKGLIAQTQGRSSIKFNLFQDSEISEWPIDTSVLLYRVLQESLTNILRHSHAVSAGIHIKEIEDKIILKIIDDGKFTADTPFQPGFGLKGIMERCTMQGGICFFSPVQPHGFRTTAIIPIHLESAQRNRLKKEENYG